MTKNQGIILDLEDVVTDTTEYVFLAWKECVGWRRKHPRGGGDWACDGGGAKVNGAGYAVGAVLFVMLRYKNR